MTPRRWTFWIDRGGTFTDCLGRDPDTGAIHVAKVLSSDRAPLEAIRAVLGVDEAAAIPPCHVRMGTTVATNALLERTGARTGLLITRGFEDLLLIGDQARPDLFALDIVRPPPLAELVLGVPVRGTKTGDRIALDDDGAWLEALRRAVAQGVESWAVVVLHGWADPSLEEEIAAEARAAGAHHVVCSSTSSPGIGLLARAETAVVDAYLTPVLQRYLAGLGRELAGSRIELMQSSGGMCPPERFLGPAAVLSGPAGGVVAAGEVARHFGFEEAIGFDMGGTSTDACRIGPGGVNVRHQASVAGVRLRTPMTDVHTVAAGGGSICRYDGGRLVVGPASAGAEPGPLCYGRDKADAITVTDCNVVTGRLPVERFPFPVDVERAREALDVEASRIGGRLGDAQALAEAFVELADAHMAEAIRQVSVARGFDVREHALVVFGGAGGQHACGVARRLGIRTLLLHPWAGVLSAFGMSLASAEARREADGGRRLLDDDGLNAARARLTVLTEEASSALMGDGHAPGRLEPRAVVSLRYRGSDATLDVEVAAAASCAVVRQAFEGAHRRTFGWVRAGHPIEVHRLAVVVRARVEPVAAPAWPRHDRVPSPRRTTTVTWQGRPLVDVPVLDREELSAGTRLLGPAVVLDPTGALWLAPRFALTVAPEGTLLVEDQTPSAENVDPRTTRPLENDPARLAFFVGAFASIAEQMGETLRRTALSTNIKERLDFSCALFDSAGELVANAPHIPVHLGAMAETVRSVLAACPSPRPGDSWATNDPAAGGSHLPDITAVTPIHDEEGALRYFTASRGHHADVGGITPGSMPPFASTLDEEGVILRHLKLTEGGRLLEDELRAALAAGPHPARDPEQNAADLHAQLAANRLGGELLLELSSKQGYDTVAAFMRYVQDHAASSVARAIARLEDGERHFADALDDGTPIMVRLTVTGDRMRIDFTGTGASVPGNLNAPRAVTVAAVLYVLRVLAGEELPLASGCLRPVDLVIPRGSVLDPPPGAAVAGGNVETSQRVVDVLLAAMGLAAASQGTMNNLTLGDERFGYYETLGGGAGGTVYAAGASAVHTHMTNTRLTDAEVLEERHPLRIEELSVRRGSGGAGRHPGGDGMVRRFRALRSLQGAILSERRRRGPFGLGGGAPGLRGQNTLSGRVLEGATTFEMAPGDELCIETPGGGGFGAPTGEDFDA